MGGEKHILVVEDDAAIRQLVTELLTESGYRVTAAANGHEGLERAAAAPPDLILLDKLMPDSDGTTFATGYAKTAGPRAPIVALCAAHDGPAWAAQIGAASYLIKPFDIETLLDVVREQLARAGDPA